MERMKNVKAVNVSPIWIQKLQNVPPPETLGDNNHTH